MNRTKKHRMVIIKPGTKLEELFSKSKFADEEEDDEETWSTKSLTIDADATSLRVVCSLESNVAMSRVLISRQYLS